MGVPSADPVRDLLGLAVRVIVGMAILGLIVAIVVGVATAGLAIAAAVITIGLMVTAWRWVSRRVKRTSTPHGVTGVHREDRIDPETGQRRRTTVIDVD